jgi:hypothetical protein
MLYRQSLCFRKDRKQTKTMIKMLKKMKPDKRVVEDCEIPPQEMESEGGLLQEGFK